MYEIDKSIILPRHTSISHMEKIISGKINERDKSKIEGSMKCLKIDHAAELEPMLPIPKMKYLLNALIDDGSSAYVGNDAVKFMQSIYDQANINEVIQVCAGCTRKIGTMRCKRCWTKYCSKTCQISHWAQHKKNCVCQ